MLKRPELPDGFQGKDSVRGYGRRMRDQLVDLLLIGWW